MAKVTRSATAYDVTVQSESATEVTLWTLRDFLEACASVGIPETARVTAVESHDTYKFARVWVRHTFVVDSEGNTHK